MPLSQDIGMIRGALMHQALSASGSEPPQGARQRADPRLLRELLDEAHARIRALEKAMEQLTAPVERVP